MSLSKKAQRLLEIALGNKSSDASAVAEIVGVLSTASEGGLQAIDQTVEAEFANGLGTVNVRLTKLGRVVIMEIPVSEGGVGQNLHFEAPAGTIPPEFAPGGAQVMQPAVTVVQGDNTAGMVWVYGNGGISIYSSLSASTGVFPGAGGCGIKRTTVSWLIES